MNLHIVSLRFHMGSPTSCAFCKSRVIHYISSFPVIIIAIPAIPLRKVVEVIGDIVLGPVSCRPLSLANAR